MVVVEIRAPVYDEESGQVEWRLRALVKADGAQLEITGDTTVLGDKHFSVVDIQTSARLSRSDDPEVWARNLPHAYRAGDLVARVVIDTNPPDVPLEPETPRDLPIVPAPPPAADRTGAVRSA